MARPEVYFIKTGDELIKAYDEIGIRPAGGEEALRQYAETVGTGTHDYLVARIGKRAVASVFVKKNGPVEAEKKVF